MMKQNVCYRVLAIVLGALVLVGMAGCKQMDELTGYTEPTQAPTQAPTTEPAPETTAPTETTAPAVTYQYRYEIIKSDMSWADAEAACRARGGYLATINSAAEYEEICKLADETKLKYLWVGARLSYDSTAWKWTDGQLIPMENYYWCRTGEINEPSFQDKGDGVREDCLCLWRYPVGDWGWTLNDQRNDLAEEFPEASGLLGYVCEYKVEVNG